MKLQDIIKVVIGKLECLSSENEDKGRNLYLVEKLRRHFSRTSMDKIWIFERKARDDIFMYCLI
jgi:hypothetical protein